MKRKILLCAGLVLLAAVGALTWSFRGRQPLRGLTAGDIQSAQVELFPPDVTIQLTREEIDRLVPLLNQVVIYRRDDSWREYDGQLCRFTLDLTDGSQTIVQAYNPFLILDDVGWRCGYAPCEALNHFANTLRN